MTSVFSEIETVKSFSDLSMQQISQLFFLTVAMKHFLVRAYSGVTEGGRGSSCLNCELSRDSRQKKKKYDLNLQRRDDKLVVVYTLIKVAQLFSIMLYSPNI